MIAEKGPKLVENGQEQEILYCFAVRVFFPVIPTVISLAKQTIKNIWRAKTAKNRVKFLSFPVSECPFHTWKAQWRATNSNNWKRRKRQFCLQMAPTFGLEDSNSIWPTTWNSVYKHWHALDCLWMDPVKSAMMGCLGAMPLGIRCFVGLPLLGVSQLRCNARHWRDLIRPVSYRTALRLWLVPSLIAETITKYCHSSGHWMGKSEDDFARPHGLWLPSHFCIKLSIYPTHSRLDKFHNVLYGRGGGNNAAAGQWHTAASSGAPLGKHWGNSRAFQEVAKNARKVEFVGLGLSLISLIFCIAIFTGFRYSQSIKETIMIHIVSVVCAYSVICCICTWWWPSWPWCWFALCSTLIWFSRTNLAINNLSIPKAKPSTRWWLCANWCSSCWSTSNRWHFGGCFWRSDSDLYTHRTSQPLKGFYLHNQLVFAVFNTMPRLWPYLLTGYGNGVNSLESLQFHRHSLGSHIPLASHSSDQEGRQTGTLPWILLSWNWVLDFGWTQIGPACGNICRIRN